MQLADNVCRLAVYPGRGHGFFNRRETPQGLDESDYLDTLGKTKTFLQELHFIPPAANKPF